jgi:hypothetical protein
VVAEEHRCVIIERSRYDPLPSRIPAALILRDSTTDIGVVTYSVKQKQSKAIIDMHQIRDKVR